MGMIGAVVGGVASAAGSIMQGQAAQQEAEYQAQVARNNAIIARKNAEHALQVGMREEEAYRMKGTLIRSAIKARFGTSGADVNTGSAIQVQKGAALVQELDALTIRNNARRESWNQQIQATNLEAQAELNEMQGENAATAGMLGAVSSIAGIAGSVSGKWNSWRSPTPYTPPNYGTSSSIAVPVSAAPSVAPPTWSAAAFPAFSGPGPGAGPMYR